jgi:hypothetical protein
MPPRCAATALQLVLRPWLWRDVSQFRGHHTYLCDLPDSAPCTGAMGGTVGIALGPRGASALGGWVWCPLNPSAATPSHSPPNHKRPEVSPEPHNEPPCSSRPALLVRSLPVSRRVVRCCDSAYHVLRVAVHPDPWSSSTRSPPRLHSTPEADHRPIGRGRPVTRIVRNHAVPPPDRALPPATAVLPRVALG